MTIEQAHSKVFSKSRWLLQLIKDRLTAEWGDDVTTSAIQPSRENDYFIYIQFFAKKEAPP